MWIEPNVRNRHVTHVCQQYGSTHMYLLSMQCLRVSKKSWFHSDSSKRNSNRVYGSKDSWSVLKGYMAVISPQFLKLKLCCVIRNVVITAKCSGLYCGVRAARGGYNCCLSVSRHAHRCWGWSIRGHCRRVVGAAETAVFGAFLVRNGVSHWGSVCTEVVFLQLRTSECWALVVSAVWVHN